MEKHFLLSSSFPKARICFKHLYLITLGIIFPSAAEMLSAAEPDLLSPSILSQVTPTRGDWGDLEYFPLVLEPPDDYIGDSKDYKSRNEKTTWILKGNAEEVRRLLMAAGISEETTNALLDNPEFVLEKDGEVVIRPPDYVIEDLTPLQRSRLYPDIGSPTELNQFHNGYLLPPGGIHQMTRIPCGVRPEIIELIADLSYYRGSSLIFSDVDYIMAKALNETERWRILKTLQREFSMSVHLKISPESDLLRLSNYWSSDGRNMEVLPILESIIKAPGTESLDIVHLLPPAARKLLHTYPNPLQSGVGSELPDCFSTAFSFFSDEPPKRYLDYVGHILGDRYERAQKPWKMGDLILFYDPETGKWIHACNYVAAGVVFTKNGKSLGRPWVLADLKELLASYLKTEKMSALFYRLKPDFHR